VRKKYYKRLYHHKSDENTQKYKKTKKNTKKAMSEARGSDVRGVVLETKYERGRK